MKKIILTLSLLFSAIMFAQVKIGDNVTMLNTNSLLELESTNKGLLLPRVALTDTTAFGPLAAHVQGMTVYNTATAGDVTPGIYTNSGTAWVRVGSGSAAVYQNIRGKVTTITALTYILASDDYAVITNNGTGVTITLPNLTLADAGRTIFIFNNNTAAVANSFGGTAPIGVPTLNQFRAMELMWTGTIWVIMGK